MEKINNRLFKFMCEELDRQMKEAFKDKWISTYLLQESGMNKNCDILPPMLINFPINKKEDNLSIYTKKYTLNHTYSFKDDSFETSTQNEIKKCTCDIIYLMNRGCKCGGV